MTEIDNLNIEACIWKQIQSFLFLFIPYKKSLKRHINTTKMGFLIFLI